MVYSKHQPWQTKAMKIKQGNRQSQQGSVLAISLVILLVLTILGVNSMSSLVLEERMAGHTRQSMVAAQAADVALRVAEDFIRDNINSQADLNMFQNGTQGLYSPHAEPVLPLPVGFNVTLNANWPLVPVNSVLVPLQLIPPLGAKARLVGRGPQYIIEYLGTASQTLRSAANLDPNQPAITQDPSAFRITAIGWGEDINTRFLVQSTYQKNL